MAETPFTPEPGSEAGGGVPLGDGLQPEAPLSPTEAQSPAPAGLETAPTAGSEAPTDAAESAAATGLPAPAAAPLQPGLPSPDEAPAIPSSAAGPVAAAASEVAPPPPQPAPEPEPPQAPQPEPATGSTPAPEPPGVAATIAVPPLDEEEGDGGEWQLLVNGLADWLSSGELNRQWQRIRGPLKGVAILVLLLVVLRLYATVVTTVDAIPLVSGLLELAGLITVIRFGGTRLLRSGDRRQLLERIQRRWNDFRGNG